MAKGFAVTTLIWLTLCVLLHTDAKVNYDKHRVVSVLPLNKGHLAGLKLLVENSAKFQVDVWRYPAAVGKDVIIRIPPWSAQEVSGILRLYNLTAIVKIDDIEVAIQKQIMDNEARKLDRKYFNYGIYHTLSEIQDWVVDLSRRYKGLVSLFNVTRSYEGRSMMGFRISTGSVVDSQQKTRPIFLFHGGMHAREWIGPATVIYMANQLLEQYGVDPDVTAAVDCFDWYIIPVVNVDGYDYTWTQDRMWRKTRTPQGTCFGVDPNRNFDYKWNHGGASSDPCDDTYMGPRPFSEQITKGLADFIKSRAANIRVYIDFHSFSQLWMSPWGYSFDLPEEFKQQDAGSAVAVKALGAVYGTDFEHGNVANTIYQCSGISVDWVHAVAGIKYSYTAELRDKGEYGFLLPPDQIIPSGRETFAAVLALANYTMNNP